MDDALVEHAEDEVDGDDRRKDEERLVGECLAKHLRGA